MENKDIELSDYMKSVVKKGRRRMMLQTAITGIFPLIGGLVLADEFVRPSENRNYAYLKLATVSSLLGFYYFNRFKPEYKKTKARLDKMFDEEKAYVGSGNFWFVDSKSPWVFENGCSTRKINQYQFSMSDFSPKIKEMAKRVWKDVISFALAFNYRENMGIKKSVEHALWVVLKRDVKPFFYGAKLRDFSNDKDLFKIFELKMVQEIYQKLSKCQNDESVLAFLEKGIENPLSLFSKVKMPECSDLFLNREVYSSGCKFQIKGLEALGYTATAGIVFNVMNSNFFSLTSAFLSGVGAFSFLTAAHVRAKHMYSQTIRYRHMERGVKILTPLKVLDFKSMDKCGWVELETVATEYGHVKEVDDSFKDVIAYLEKIPNKTCREASKEVSNTFILEDTTLAPIYSALMGGATLEMAAKKYGVNTVNRLMLIHMMVRDLACCEDRTVHYYLFEAKAVDCYADAVDIAKNRVQKTLLKKEAYTLALFEKGEISKEEKDLRLSRLMTETYRTKNVIVPAETKLPVAVARLQKKNKEFSRVG